MTKVIHHLDGNPRNNDLKNLRIMEQPTNRRTVELWEEGVHLIPAHMQQSVSNYINTGHPIGGFLTAIMSNDLLMTHGTADEKNLAALPNWLAFIYNHAPSPCHGSREKVKTWIERGGLRGKVNDD